MLSRRVHRVGRAAAVALTVAIVSPPLPGRAQLPLEVAATAIPGFAITSYVATGDAPTSLAFGPDTRDLSETRLYVTLGHSGQVVAIDRAGGVGGPPAVFATGFQQPLGVLAAADGTIYVTDSEGPRDGPFGIRRYGRVWRLRDLDGDGVAETKQIVLKDLPNGRHNTNGMAFGPDGLLYVANGNSNDDGVDGGSSEVEPWSGSVVRLDPASTDVSLIALDSNAALVAHGMRNLYDLAFSPIDPTKLFIPTNGVDDARPQAEETPIGLEDSDDLLYLTDVDDVQTIRRKRRPPVIDDFGFPSCLYNQARQGNLEPYDNPNPAVIPQYGPCPTETVPRPVHSFGAHPSANGLAFQTTAAWGDEFRNDLFVAEFGNFFGPRLVGHKVVRLDLDPTGQVVIGESDLIQGVLPLDVTFDAAGDLFVADWSGSIYRVTKVT